MVVVEKVNDILAENIPDKDPTASLVGAMIFMNIGVGNSY